jgi:hypothetical protein
MTNFDAAVDELTYDFTQYVEGAQGTIPEPSVAQVETFTEMLRQVMPTAVNEKGDLILDVNALKAKVEEGDDLALLINNAIADLCSGSPTAAQIAALPFRVQRRFYGWIIGTFLSPEA